MERIFRAIVLGAAALTSGAQVDRANTRRTEPWPELTNSLPLACSESQCRASVGVMMRHSNKGPLPSGCAEA